MDALRLSYTAKDQLHPLLSEVIAAVNNVAGAKEFEGRQNIVKWLIVLNQMGAGDEITEAQGRQVCFFRLFLCLLFAVGLAWREKKG